MKINFSDFSNQMKMTDLLIKLYQYKYDKFSKKLSSLEDILHNNENEIKEFLEKVEKLEILDAKLSHVEAKMHMINKKIDNVNKKIDS